MRILVIEDNQAIANAFVKVLYDDGHVARSISNPLVAISNISRETYDLILVDYLLPEINGLDLVSRLRSAGVEQQVIMTTNMLSGIDPGQAAKLGIKEIVLKSELGPNELCKLVAKYAQS